MQPLETRALELVAAALSEEYGVRVVSGGLRAHTGRDANNIPVITIPAVPLHDENYRLLVRGYVDHEVGHVRFGNEKALETAQLSEPALSGALKAVASIYEDIYIDRMMGECFIGCGRNLRKLVLLLYGETSPPDAAMLLEKLNSGIMPPRELPWHIWHATVQYLLYFARSRTLPQLLLQSEKWRDALDLLAPGLARTLESILVRLPAEGISCEANIALARETVEAIKDWFFNHWQFASAPWHDECLRELPWLLRNGGEERELADMGKLASHTLDKLINQLADDSPIKVNCLWHKRGSDLWRQRLLPLTSEEREEALKAAARMSAQMQALLQSHVLNREGPFRQGKLDMRNLYKLFTGRDDLFRRVGERREINTEIACCIDMSGSMRFDEKDAMASRALYAVAESLSHIQGLKMTVLGFFDNNIIEMYASPAPLHPRMKIVPDGGTLLGAALRASTRSFSHDAKKRKIVILITDGDANDPEFFEEAIKDLKKDGLEILGIGIHDANILQYLAQENCCVINNLGELAGSVLAMLRKTMGIRA